MNKYLGEFQVEELFDIKEIGVTMPVLCRIDNGKDVIAKYMRNPFGQQVLINELIGSGLADMLEINVPDYGICNLSENVIFETPHIDCLDTDNAGPCFFSVYHGDTVPITKRLLSSLKPGEFESLVLFDHIIANHDRHKGNLLIKSNKAKELFIIDHSHIFGKGITITADTLSRELNNETILSSAILRDNMELYDLLFKYVGFDDEQLIKQSDKFRKMYSNDSLQKVLETIPELWIGSGKGDILKCIVELINKRIMLIDDICEMIIKERRLL